MVQRRDQSDVDRGRRQWAAANLLLRPVRVRTLAGQRFGCFAFDRMLCFPLNDCSVVAALDCRIQ